MKKILFVFISFCLAGELEVDGDLKVTGTIQNDSLAQVINLQQEEIASLLVLISQLQAQIALLESQMALVGGDLGYADCFGIVGGGAVIDECGVCGGSGIAEGECDCNGNVFDICGDCGGDITDEDECEINYTLSFDGDNDYVFVAEGENVFNINNSLTMSGWININEWKQNTVFDGTSSTSNNPNRNAGFKLVLSENGLFHVFVGIVVDHSESALSSISTLPLSQWVYISAVRSGSVLQLYINGQLDAERTDLSTNDISYDGNAYESDLYKIGCLSDINNPQGLYYFHGGMSSFELYNIALEPTQIQSYMANPPIGNESGLVGYWNFNEGSGTTVIDQTGNGNHGTIHGATWVER